MSAPDRSSVGNRYIISLVVTLLAVAGLQPGLSTQAPSAGIPVAVTDQVGRDGSARVIVGVRTTFVPEGFLATQADVVDQRAAMQMAVDGAMGRAAASGALLGDRFETIPFFTAVVDANALAALAAMPEIASIELDALDRPLLAQSVPLINAPAAWTAGHTGSGWSVAVLDTGVEKTHAFFGGRVVSEACYSNANGGGGATSVCPGGVPISVATGSGVNCSTSISGCDHGTHVAGIVAGASSIGGPNGVAPQANLIAMQVFTRFDSSTSCGSSPPCVRSFASDQIRALERVLVLAGTGNVNRIAAVNMSLGGSLFTAACDADEPARKTAIDNLLSIGIPTIVASGNEGSTNSVNAPACISTAISVGSSTKGDGMSSFGNRGSGLVDLLAPGGDGTFGGAINSSVTGNQFGVKQGTSMAAPHVAGAWAVLKHAVPDVSVANALAALVNTGVTINDAGSGASYRRINVNAARQALLGTPTVIPGAPGTPVITGNGNSVTVTWTPPLTGGTPTSYTVVARAVVGGPVVAALPVGSALTLTVTAPSGSYHVTVVASNSAGPGPESAGVTFSVPIVTPPPGVPTELEVTVTGNQAAFTWTPPASGGPVTGYLLLASPSSGGPTIAALPFAAPASSATVNAIPAGTYFVRLAATNVGGPGPLSNEVIVTVVGPQPPGPSTLNPAVVDSGRVSLTWTAPTTGGTPTSFVVVASATSGGPPIATLPVTALGMTVPAPRGTYFVRVHGVNALGTGPASNEITVVVP
jgi:subtilisin family serine protease